MSLPHFLFTFQQTDSSTKTAPVNDFHVPRSGKLHLTVGFDTDDYASLPEIYFP